ncbi:hypothetical protein JMUB5695_02834 [Mycobacterium heckeshornense]|uniref:Uncharacterized protein n=1 Tax=Mycobacterium heckeshornense TaxID=110505 RepID=A0A7R7YS52_9MYCO|nr:hypothetical protein MHEC_29220 [Mycobacterium heckeshornense]BCQ09390.1 hypothetical protein JMUB5695_02834 [Mycobacterium heckeshornense]
MPSHGVPEERAARAADDTPAARIGAANAAAGSSSAIRGG